VDFLIEVHCIRDLRLLYFSEIIRRYMEDLIVDTRPVNLDLRTIKMPYMATLSILHRISGIVLFFGMPILLWILHESLQSVESYQTIETLLREPFYRFIFLGILAAFGYHVIAGIKHLFMDRGIGDSIDGAKISSRLVTFFSLLWFIFLGTQL